MRCAPPSSDAARDRRLAGRRTLSAERALRAALSARSSVTGCRQGDREPRASRVLARASRAAATGRARPRARSERQRRRQPAYWRPAEGGGAAAIWP